MSKLPLSIAIGDYDRVRPLVDGSVQIDGVDPVFMLAGTRGNLLPRIPPRRLRHVRIVDEQFLGQDRERRLSLCRSAGVSVARLPS